MRVISVGIDVGGTFTDLLAIDAEGRARWHKVPSTPADQSAGILEVLRRLGDPPAQVGRIVHGTTVATNMLLERRGSRVVLCATAGAADLLELRRQDRASLYDLTRHHPPSLVAAGDVVPVDERMGPHDVVRPLANAAVASAVDAVATRQPEAVAVSLLHSYRDPSHERMLADALRERLGPGVAVVASHDVLPEIREYERTATAVAEAYLRRGVATYLTSLTERMDTAGYRPPAVMTSAGGMRDAPAATRSAASLALSGPAGGMVAAAALARRVGLSRALTIDVGGTSADAGLIDGGEPLVEPGGEIAGVPIALPRVLVETVSAGGGSIAWIDAGGALRVGPRSAGAEPGPACYGRGGDAPTVTDAQVVLGNIGQRAFGDGLRIDAELALAALSKLATALGSEPRRVAEAIVATAEAEIARALRRVSVERGIDPRGCALIAFGGAGPLHACALAERLGMMEVYVPPFAGVLSALGLAIAPWQGEAAQSVMEPADSLAAGGIGEIMGALAARAAGAEHGTPRWWARARYAGQGYELDVPVASGDDGRRIAEGFSARHSLRAGFVLDRPVEIVSVRCAVAGSMVDPPHGSVFRADIEGPATHDLGDATLVVPRHWLAKPSPHGGLHLRRSR